MSGFLQVCAIFFILFCLHSTRGKPFGEFVYKKNTDFVFKPLPFKPLAFVKETWGPFGVWGKKHGLAKRDLDSIQPMDRVSVPLEKTVTRLPAEVYEVPVETVPPPPPMIPVTPVPHEQIPAPPLGPVLITPPPKQKEPVEGLYTDIYRNDYISTYLKEIEKSLEKPIVPEEKGLPPPSIDNSIVPDKKIEISPLPKDEPNPIVKGSRLALYIGNVLLDILSRVLGGPKLEKPVTI